MAKQFIENIIKDMTLREKIAQMTQLVPFFFGADPGFDITGPMSEMNITEEDVKNLGSTLNCHGAEQLIKMQDNYMANNRHKIPALFMADVINGFKTIFPIPLALGCSFNPDNYRITCETAAKECSASGIHLTFAPMTDLVRDPRWGRVMESTGEDTYLNSVMTKAAVMGFQGDDPKSKGHIAACVKHFAGYGLSEGGRDYNWVDISSHSLHQYYLPAYKAAVDAGVKMVMTAFNVIDGVPASASKLLFREILRDKWGFKGSTISDFGAIDEIAINGLAKDGKEAARMAVEAGVDIEMMSTHYLNFIEELVQDGELDIELVNDAVRNILVLKDDLGLFENPYKDADPVAEKKLHQCDEHKALARRIASECAVLLKNDDNVLPLKKSMKVGIAGPFAKGDNTMGGWALASDKDGSSLFNAFSAIGITCVTAMDGALGEEQNGIFDVDDHIDEACKALSDCDIIIAAVGEHPGDTGEAASKTNIRLSRNQERMIEALSGLGKPVVTVVFSGRPMEIAPILPYTNALIQAWMLGSESGYALSDIIFGDANPSARLSMSFPYTVGQIPVYYNAYNTGRPAQGKTERYISRYLDCPNEALFPFGFGLSYSTFSYSDFSVTVTDGQAVASVNVKNTSEIAGIETVQLYIRDPYASIVRPLKELKDFTRIELQSNEQKTVSFVVTKDMLSFFDKNLEWIFEAGEFDIMIGSSSVDLHCTRIELS